MINFSPFSLSLSYSMNLSTLYIRRRPIITATTTTTTTTTTTPRTLDDAVLKLSDNRTPMLSSTSTPVVDQFSISTIGQDGSMESTTSLPLLMSSFDAPKKIGIHPSYLSLKLDQERGINSVIESKKTMDSQEKGHNKEDAKSHSQDEYPKHFQLLPHKTTRINENLSLSDEDSGHENTLNNEQIKLYHHQENYSSSSASGSRDDASNQHDSSEDTPNSDEVAVDVEDIDEDQTEKYSDEDKGENEDSANIVPTHDHNGNVDDDSSILHERYDLSSLRHPGDSAPTSVELRLKQITQEVQKRTRNDAENHHLPHSLTPDLDDIGHQSFLSLSDLIRTLRPNDKQIIPQIDSDYSNAMRVLGEKSVVVNNEQ